MKRAGRISAILTVTVLATIAFGSPVLAVEVLLNTGLEESTGPVGWNLTQSITGEPESPISAWEHVDQANEPAAAPGELGILIKGASGNNGIYADQNKAVNVTLQQTVAAPPGTYTLTGHSYFQAASSAIIDTLYADSPSGAVASPSTSYIRMEFLNSSDTVLGTQEVNLRTDPTTEVWRTHTLMGTGPAGTSKVRVTTATNDLVASCTDACPAGQDIRIDNFTLRNATSPGFERLTNNGLNQIGAPSGWSIEKTPEDNISFSGNPSFAAHSGGVGMWLRSFSGGDAKILQTAPAVAGEDYTFTAWGKLQEGHSGLDPFSGTVTFMQMEFLDGSNAVIGAPVFQNIGTSYTWDPGTGGQGVWQQIGLPTTEAPVGAANVRVSIGATGMMDSTFNPQSALFDDFSLMTTAAPPGLTGDYNGDNVVDARDYVLWRKNPGAHGGDPQGYNDWRANFGAMSPGSAAVATPEPGSIALLLIAFGMVGCNVTRYRR